MIRVKQAIVVEGRYDRIRLASLVDAVVVETGGFRIFKDPDRVEMLRTLAKTTGLLVLTDSDAAGFKIRSYIKSCVREGEVLHAYIPDILGKERRKQQPSREGKLGVEGVSDEALLTALRRAGVLAGRTEARSCQITKADFFEDGLTGTPGSAGRRRELCARLGLPAHLSANSLLTVLCALLDRQEYKRLVSELAE